MSVPDPTATDWVPVWSLKTGGGAGGGVAWRGTWAADADYVAGDMVQWAIPDAAYFMAARTSLGEEPVWPPPPVPQGYFGTVVEDGPTGYWRMNEGVGDSSLASATGDVPAPLSGPWASAPGALNDPDTAMDFSAGGYANAPESTYLDLAGPLTLEAWVKFPAEPVGGSYDYRILFGRMYGASYVYPYYQYALYVAPPGRFGVHLLTDVGGASWDSGIVIPWTDWTHVVFVWEQPNGKLYLDGALAATWTLAANSVGFPGGQFSFANIATLGGYTVPVFLDEVAVFAYALTPERVLAHYNAGINPPPGAEETAPAWILMSEAS